MLRNKLKLLSVLFIIIIAFPFRIREKIIIFNSVSIFDIALLIFSIVLLLYVFYNDGKLYVGKKFIFLLLCIHLLIGLFSIVWSKDIAETFYYIIVDTEAVLSYLVTVNLLRKSKSEWTMSLMAILSLLIIIPSILSYFRMPGFTPYIPYEIGSIKYNVFIASYYTRLSSPFFGLSNNLATVLAYFFFPIWTWWIISGKRSYLLLTSIILVSIIMTISKGVLISIAITIPFFIYWQKVRIKLIIQPIFLAIILCAAGFAAVYAFSGQFRIYAPYLFSIRRIIFVEGIERLQRYEAALSLIGNSPLYGYGAKVIPPDFGFQGNIHNTYLEQMVYFGIPLGMISIASLTFLPFGFERGSWKRNLFSRVRAGIVSAIVCQLVIFITESSFEGSTLKVLFYVSIGLSVALINSLTQQLHELQKVEL